MASILNIGEIVRKQMDEEILKRRAKILVQRCFENPALNHEVIVKFLNKKIEWEDDSKTIRDTVESIQRDFQAGRDVRKDVKQFIQRCFENPQTNYEVIETLLKRKIEWKTINQYILHGEVVKCKLCEENSVTGFWCKPCIHRKEPYCCYCCILLGIPFYR